MDNDDVTDLHVPDGSCCWLPLDPEPVKGAPAQPPNEAPRLGRGTDVRA